jgi:hypothetical protein
MHEDEKNVLIAANKGEGTDRVQKVCPSTTTNDHS